LGIPLPPKREFEQVILVDVLIEEMFGSDRNRPLDYERAVVVNVEDEENDERRKKKLFQEKRRSLFKIVFDRADMVREVR
jgi:hypothetical protein